MSDPQYFTRQLKSVVAEFRHNLSGLHLHLIIEVSPDWLVCCLRYGSRNAFLVQDYGGVERPDKTKIINPIRSTNNYKLSVWTN